MHKLDYFECPANDFEYPYYDANGNCMMYPEFDPRKECDETWDGDEDY